MPLSGDFTEKWARPLLQLQAEFRGVRLVTMSQRELIALVGYLCDLRGASELLARRPAPPAQDTA